MDRLEKELEVLTAGVGVIGDRRPQPAPASEMELDELEMEQVEIDIDLDDGGPVPEELRRPVKVRLAGGRVEKPVEEDEWERALRAAGGESWMEIGGDRAPAEWDRARDPPMLTRAKGELEPVQRPGKAEKKKDAYAVGSELKGKDPYVPHVELYDARLPVRGYEYPYKYDPYGYDPYAYDRAYHGYDQAYKYDQGYSGYNPVGKGAYEYPSKGVYYAPAYEAVPRDAIGYDAYDYYPGSYVPRQVQVPTWVPHRNGCVPS
jgi:hypothetical protein